MTPPQQRRCRAVLAAAGPRGLAMALHFPLHPDVDPRLDPGTGSVVLTLRSGEAWVFEVDGPGLALTLDPAVHFDHATPALRHSRQIVVTARVTSPAQQIGWTLAKTQDTPVGIRDVAPDEDTPA